MSLVAAAVSALFVVSAVIAVRGWPDIAPAEQRSDALQLAELPSSRDAAPDASGQAPAPIVLVSDVPPREPDRRRSAGRTSTPAPGTPAAPVPASGGAPAPAPAATPDEADDRGVTRPVGDAIGNAGDQGGDVVDPVAPQAGGIVRDTTGAVSDAARQVGEGAGAAVEPVAPKTGRGVDDVTGAVGQAVEDTGGVVDDVLSGLLGAVALPTPLAAGA